MEGSWQVSNCVIPCHDCPFAKHTPAGALGGGSLETYLGQIVGPFFLPCHNSPGYNQFDVNLNNRQCAGAAVFRSNLGVDRLMPGSLLHLPAGDLVVFPGLLEFVVHHGRMSSKEAKQWLQRNPWGKLLRQELAKQEAKLCLIERPSKP